ncbi:MAG: DUF1874 domain-containing protein [Candidatus Micrarchaeaceae archaeon]
MNSKKYLANAFSLSMLEGDRNIIEIKEIHPEEILKNLSEINSVIGHETTAQIVSEILGIPIQVNRSQIKLNKFDELFVFQLLERLPEGKILTHDEIKQIKHKWYKVIVLR